MALSSSSATAWISASAAAPTTAVSIRLRIITRWNGRMRDWAPRTTSSSETGSGQWRPARAPQSTARVWARRACWAAAWSALSRPSSRVGSSWVRSISSSKGLLVVGHDEDPAGHAEEGPLGGGVEFVVLLGGGQFGAAAGEFGRELFPEAVDLVFLLGDPTALGGGDRAVAGGGHQGESGEHACCRCAPLSHRHAANSRAMIL